VRSHASHAILHRSLRRVSGDQFSREHTHFMRYASRSGRTHIGGVVIGDPGLSPFQAPPIRRQSRRDQQNRSRQTTARQKRSRSTATTSDQPAMHVDDAEFDLLLTTPQAEVPQLRVQAPEGRRKSSNSQTRIPLIRSIDIHHILLSIFLPSAAPANTPRDRSHPSAPLIPHPHGS
jgi:hypothetical protein